MAELPSKPLHSSVGAPCSIFGAAAQAFDLTVRNVLCDLARRLITALQELDHAGLDGREGLGDAALEDDKDLVLM